MNSTLAVEVEPLQEGGYVAASKDLPGLVAQGRTMAETIEIAQDVARRLIESYLEHGDALPPKIKLAFKGTEPRNSKRRGDEERLFTQLAGGLGEAPAGFWLPRYPAKPCHR
jgi:predicted RNase H-like HicB family nuclease